MAAKTAGGCGRCNRGRATGRWRARITGDASVGALDGRTAAHEVGGEAVPVCGIAQQAVEVEQRRKALDCLRVRGLVGGDVGRLVARGDGGRRLLHDGRCTARWTGVVVRSVGGALSA